MTNSPTKSHVVPMSAMLRNVVTMLLAAKQLASAESSLKGDIEISTFDGSNRRWVDVCRTKFYSPIVTNALSKCGVPQNDVVFEKLMGADQWPREVFTTAGENLPELFVFDSKSLTPNLVRVSDFDLAHAPAAVLRTQIDAFIPVLIEAMEKEYRARLAKEHDVYIEFLEESGIGLSDIPVDGFSLWNVAGSSMQQMPFVKGVGNLPEQERDGMVLEIYEAFFAQIPQQEQPARERARGDH